MIAAVIVALALSGLQTATWDGIRLDGWTYFGEATDGSLLMFTKGARGEGLRSWARFEYAEPDSNGARSIRTLNEFDCQQGRVRTLQWDSFAENNLSGTGRVVPQTGDWKYPAPGTFGEGHFLLMCPDPN